MAHYPLPWRRTASQPACTGPCHQGRAQCPCPENCRLPDDDGGPRHPITGARPLVIFILAALAIVGCAAVVVFAR